MAKLWLRAETYGKPSPDCRTPLTPELAERLVKMGHEVFVEDSSYRVYKNDEYKAVGCKIVKTRSWYTAPADAFILGIKYLPQKKRSEPQFPLHHNLIYFAHGWNGDESGTLITSRLEERELYAPNRSKYYDLEDLVDDNNRRVAAFGVFAGYAGALTALHTWCAKELGKKPPYKSPAVSLGREKMVEKLRADLKKVEREKGKTPLVLVIGPNGRCGNGAVQLLDELGIEHNDWTRKETIKGYPFPEIFDHDIFLNCVSFDPKNPKFVTKADLESEMRLSVIGDISCYPGPYNPIDIYDEVTSHSNLSHSIPRKNGVLDVLAVENLPRLLAREASVEYSNALFPHIVSLLNSVDKGTEPSAVWQRAEQKANDILRSVAEVKDLGMSISIHCFKGPGGAFESRKALDMVSEWLERNPLTMQQKAGFNEYLLDGTLHTYKLRKDSEARKWKDQRAELEQWLRKVDIEVLCSRPDIKLHHALENEANRFLVTYLGRMVMDDDKLRKQYTLAIEYAHEAVNKNDMATRAVDQICSEVARGQTDYLGKEITKAFTKLKDIATPALAIG